MNKLLTNFNGGYPIELDDLRFREEAYRNAIQSFVSSLSTHAILTGCEISENTQTGLFQVNQGWVVIDGEIGFLPQTTGLDETHEYAIIADNFIDNSVVKLLYSGQSVKPNEIRQFKIEQWSPQMNVDAKLWGMKTMVNRIKEKLAIPQNVLEGLSIIDTPQYFVWSATNNRWEAKMPHHKSNLIPILKGVTILIGGYGNPTRRSLPVLIDYEVDDTYVHFYEYSAQGSLPLWRDLILNNGINCVFII